MIASREAGGSISRILGIPQATEIEIRMAVNSLVEVRATFYPTAEQMQRISDEFVHRRYALTSLDGVPEVGVI